MSSSAKSARKARPPRAASAREAVTDPVVAERRRQRVRAQLLQRSTHPRTATDLLLDSIAACPDAVNASELIADAIAAEHDRDAEKLLPAAGWILPPG